MRDSSIQKKVSENSCPIFWGPYYEDPTIWGTILGFPIFGNPQKDSIIRYSASSS